MKHAAAAACAACMSGSIEVVINVHYASLLCMQVTPECHAHILVINWPCTVSRCRYGSDWPYTSPMTDTTSGLLHHWFR